MKGGKAFIILKSKTQSVTTVASSQGHKERFFSSVRNICSFCKDKVLFLHIIKHFIGKANPTFHLPQVRKSSLVHIGAMIHPIFSFKVNFFEFFSKKKSPICCFCYIFVEVGTYTEQIRMLFCIKDKLKSAKRNPFTRSELCNIDSGVEDIFEGDFI